MLDSIFGSGVIGSFSNVLKGDVLIETNPQSSSAKLKSSSDTRGSLTRLSRRELTGKLSQIPVFFITNGDAAIQLDSNGNGNLFLDKVDADKYYRETFESKKGCSVSAATMADVYFPLIQKSQKLGNFVPGLSLFHSSSGYY